MVKRPYKNLTETELYVIKGNADENPVNRAEAEAELSKRSRLFPLIVALATAATAIVTAAILALQFFASPIMTKPKENTNYSNQGKQKSSAVKPKQNHVSPIPEP